MVISSMAMRRARRDATTEPTSTMAPATAAEAVMARSGAMPVWAMTASPASSTYSASATVKMTSACTAPL